MRDEQRRLFAHVQAAECSGLVRCVGMTFEEDANLDVPPEAQAGLFEEM